MAEPNQSDQANEAIGPQTGGNTATAAAGETWVDHLIELRGRLLRAVIAVLLVFIPLALLAKPLFSALAGPLLQHLPANTSLIATEVASPFLTPFKLALVAAIFLSLPYLLYQLWAFVAPGLYEHEKKIVMPLVVSSTLLFYAGVAFAYFAVFPIVFGFFVSAAPAGVTVMTDIGRYLDFVLTMFIAFGCAFEVPVATFLMVSTGVTTVARLRKARPYVLLGVFVIGMFLTPPDVISQTLLAVPMYLLFEAGILMCRFIPKLSDEESAAE